MRGGKDVRSGDWVGRAVKCCPLTWYACHPHELTAAIATFQDLKTNKQMNKKSKTNKQNQKNKTTPPPKKCYLQEEGRRSQVTNRVWGAVVRE